MELCNTMECFLIIYHFSYPEMLHKLFLNSDLTNNSRVLGLIKEAAEIPFINLYISSRYGQNGWP